MFTTASIHNRILIVEDDEPLSFFIKKVLERHGFKITCVNNGNDGLKEALSNKYMLAIVDIGLPHKSGFTIIENMRNNGVETPVIIVTSNPETEKEVTAFNTGANLFHRKPINFKLLESQVKSLIRPTKGKPIIKITSKPSISLDSGKRALLIDKDVLDLSRKEFELILALVNAKGNILSRQEIMNKTFHGVTEVEEASIDTLISRLRRKIPVDLIETVHGAGYRFNKKLIN